MTTIRVQHLNKEYEGKAVLKDVSFTVERGQMIGLLGPSGSGKTTLIKHLVGALQCKGEQVQVLGSRMPNLDTFAKIGYMAQEDALYEELTAKENLEYFGMLYGLGSKRLKERVGAILEAVALGEDLHKEVKKFSGGMKRRLSLSIALIHEPEVLILDEPTVGIDPLMRRSIWQELIKLNRQGTTILVTTHVMAEVEQCDKIAMIREGELIAYAGAQALMEQSRTASLEQAFLYFSGGSHAY